MSSYPLIRKKTEDDEDTPGIDMYRENLLTMPTRGKPSIGNKIVTALGGAFFGPEEALKIQGEPYQESIQDWARKTEASGKLAGLEVQSANSKALNEYRKANVDAKNSDIERKREYGDRLLAQRAREAKNKLDVALQNAKTSEEKGKAYRDYVNDMHQHHQEADSLSREKNAIARDKANKQKELSPGQEKVFYENQLNAHLANHPEDRPLILKYKRGENLSPEESSRVQFILSNARRPRGTKQATSEEIDDYEPDSDEDDVTIEEER